MASTPATGLTPSQLDERLAEFQSFTGLEDDEKCKVILRQTDWNVQALRTDPQRAVDMFFEERDFGGVGVGGGAGSGSEDSSRPSSQGSASAGSASAAGSAAGRSSPPAGAAVARGLLLPQPRPLVTFGPRPFQWLVNTMWSVLFALGYRALHLVQLLLLGPQSTEQRRIQSAQDAAQRFVQRFEASYGTMHPEFAVSSYTDVWAAVTARKYRLAEHVLTLLCPPSQCVGGQYQALNAAKRSQRLLLVYLHCDDHDDSDAFCRNTLASDAFRQYIATNNILLWAGDVRYPEPAKVAERLQVATYPFVAMLDQSQSPTRILAVDGLRMPQALIDGFQTFLERNRQAANAARAAREAREMERRLREDQEREYQAALRADEERQRAQAQQRAEEERRLAEERATAERERLEAERAERERAEAAERKAALAREKAARLPPEPAPNTPNVTRIAFRLPNGRRIDRRFCVEDPVQVLYDYLESDVTLELPPFRLQTSFQPKKVFDDKSQTLRDAGLTSSVVLIVDEIIEDEAVVA